MSRQSIEIPNNVKQGLEEMSKQFGMSQNALINLAVTTMVTKYQTEGVRIFFDLISQPNTKK